MSRTQNAIVRGRWIGRAGLWAALGLTLAAGIAAPAAGAVLTGTAATAVVADGGATSSPLGNGWGG